MCVHSHIYVNSRPTNIYLKTFKIAEVWLRVHKLPQYAVLTKYIGFLFFPSRELTLKHKTPTEIYISVEQLTVFCK